MVRIFKPLDVLGRSAPAACCWSARASRSRGRRGPSDCACRACRAGSGRPCRRARCRRGRGRGRGSGSSSAAVSPTMPLKVVEPDSTISMAPPRVRLITCWPVPSELSGKTLISMPPLVRSLTSSANLGAARCCVLSGAVACPSLSLYSAANAVPASMHQTADQGVKRLHVSSSLFTRVRERPAWRGRAARPMQPIAARHSRQAARRARGPPRCSARPARPACAPAPPRAAARWHGTVR